MTNQFWKRWIHEYLPTLQECQKWFQTRRNIEVGDLVIIKETGVARNKWPLGRITEVFPGCDGRIRSAKIRSATGEFHRPISQICLCYACNEDVLLTQIKSGLLNDTETYVGTHVSLRQSKLLNKEHRGIHNMSVYKQGMVLNNSSVPSNSGV
jgi:hypothetical protein